MTYNQLTKLMKRGRKTTAYWEAIHALSDSEIKAIGKEALKKGLYLEFSFGHEFTNRYLELTQTPMMIQADVHKLHALSLSNFKLVTRGYGIRVKFKDGEYRFPEVNKTIGYETVRTIVRDKFPSAKVINVTFKT